MAIKVIEKTVVMEVNTCERCGYEWTSRRPKGPLPKACPHCKNYGWNSKAKPTGRPRRPKDKFCYVHPISGYIYNSLEEVLSEYQDITDNGDNPEMWNAAWVDSGIKPTTEEILSVLINQSGKETVNG